MNQDSVTAKPMDNGYALCYVTYVMLCYVNLWYVMFTYVNLSYVNLCCSFK